MAKNGSKDGSRVKAVALSVISLLYHLWLTDIGVNGSAFTLASLYICCSGPVADVVEIMSEATLPALTVATLGMIGMHARHWC